MSLAAELRMMLAMGLTGLGAGVLLTATDQFTAPYIARARESRLQAEVLRVLPGSVKMREERRAGQRRFVGLDGTGSVVGFAVQASGRGYQENISLLYGIASGAPRLAGLAILEHKETPGLGDKIEDAEFRERFIGLPLLTAQGATIPFAVQRPGRRTRAVGSGDESAALAPAKVHGIDAISGATISSKAVANILNASIAAGAEAEGGAP